MVTKKAAQQNADSAVDCVHETSTNQRTCCSAMYSWLVISKQWTSQKIVMKCVTNVKHMTQRCNVPVLTDHGVFMCVVAKWRGLQIYSSSLGEETHTSESCAMSSADLCDRRTDGHRCDAPPVYTKSDWCSAAQFRCSQSTPEQRPIAESIDTDHVGPIRDLATPDWRQPSRRQIYYKSTSRTGQMAHEPM